MQIVIKNQFKTVWVQGLYDKWVVSRVTTKSAMLLIALANITVTTKERVLY
jgi:hypothetical protein